MHQETVQPPLYNFPLFLLFSSSTNFLKFFLNILPVGLQNQLLSHGRDLRFRDSVDQDNTPS
jgi:hypothetical protein